MIESRLSESSILMDGFSHRCRDHLQVLGIDLAEGGGLAGIEIQDGDQSILAVEYWHHNLRSAGRIACDMTLEGVNICHNLSLSGPSRGTANSFREGDFQAARRALIGADSEQVRLHYAVETDPADPGEVFVQDSRDAGHGSHRVGEIFQQRSDLSDGCGVPAFLVDRHDVEILAPE